MAQHIPAHAAASHRAMPRAPGYGWMAIPHGLCLLYALAILVLSVETFAMPAMFSDRGFWPALAVCLPAALTSGLCCIAFLTGRGCAQALFCCALFGAVIVTAMLRVGFPAPATITLSGIAIFYAASILLLIRRRFAAHMRPAP